MNVGSGGTSAEEGRVGHAQAPAQSSGSVVAGSIPARHCPPNPNQSPPYRPRCGAPTPPAKDHATLFCQREEGHEPPHIVRGGGGQLLHKWSDDPAHTDPE